MDCKIKVQTGFNTAVEYVQLESEKLLMLDKDASEVMEIKFGDFKNQTLSDFWGKEDHIEKIQSAYDTICRNCTNAIFEN